VYTPRSRMLVGRRDEKIGSTDFAASAWNRPDRVCPANPSGAGPRPCTRPMKKASMSTTIVRLLSCVALLGLPACGDDGGGSGSEGSSTGGSSTGTGSTSTEPGSTSTAGNEGSGSGSSGPGEGSTTTGADSGSSGGSGTGAVLECDELADLETCEAAMGCLWLGNMQN